MGWVVGNDSARPLKPALPRTLVSRCAPCRPGAVAAAGWGLGTIAPSRAPQPTQCPRLCVFLRLPLACSWLASGVGREGGLPPPSGSSPTPGGAEDGALGQPCYGIAGEARSSGASLEARLHDRSGAADRVPRGFGSPARSSRVPGALTRASVFPSGRRVGATPGTKPLRPALRGLVSACCTLAGTGQPGCGERTRSKASYPRSLESAQSRESQEPAVELGPSCARRGLLGLRVGGAACGIGGSRRACGAQARDRAEKTTSSPSSRRARNCQL